MLRRIVHVLPQFAYRFSTEIELQDGVALVLQQQGIRFEREYVASKEDRFDFLCEGGIVVEVKIEGTFAECARQIQRYAALPLVQAVVIATAKFWGRSLKPDANLNGKPVRLLRLSRQAL